MLQPPRGNAGEHEHHRCEHAGRRRPARAPADQRDREPAEEQVRVDDQVEHTQRRRRVEQRPQHEGRRKDERLRIGDARMAAIVIRIPERRGPRMERRRKKAEEGVELILGVPRNHGIGEDPAARGDEPDRDDHGAARQQMAKRRRRRARITHAHIGRHRRAVSTRAIPGNLSHAKLKPGEPRDPIQPQHGLGVIKSRESSGTFCCDAMFQFNA